MINNHRCYDYFHNCQKVIVRLNYSHNCQVEQSERDQLEGRVARMEESIERFLFDYLYLD